MEFAVLEEPFARQHCRHFVVAAAVDAAGAVVILR